MPEFENTDSILRNIDIHEDIIIENEFLMEGDEIMNGEVLKLLVSKKEVKVHWRKLLLNEMHHAGNLIKHTRQKNF